MWLHPTYCVDGFMSEQYWACTCNGDITRLHVSDLPDADKGYTMTPSAKVIHQWILTRKLLGPTGT